jgi:hypothetical protein
MGTAEELQILERGIGTNCFSQLIEKSKYAVGGEGGLGELCSK